MKLSLAQIQDLMRAAGWPEDLIVTGAAVFYYESNRGETTAHKVDGVERSYGLTQINLGLPGTRLAAQRASWGPAERLYDPAYNLSLALQLYYSQGWGAWYNTYYGGRYKTYLAASQQAYNAGSAAPVVTADAGPGPTIDLSGGGGAYTAAGVTGGTALLIVGALVLGYYLLSD